MCGRFTQTTPAADVALMFDAMLDPAYSSVPRYNIAPTQTAAIIRELPAREPIAKDSQSRRTQAALPGMLPTASSPASPAGNMSPEPRGNPTERVLSGLRWGLIPRWAKDIKIASSLINARAETVSEKPSFRTAFQRRRCLVPVNGFFEWQPIEQAKIKQPHYLSPSAAAVVANRGATASEHAASQPALFAIAGLWESWKSPENTWLETFCVITTTPNAVMSRIHDRMPVILPAAVWDHWLDPAVTNPAELQPLLQPCDPEWIVDTLVTTRVNNARNEGADLIAQLPA